MVIKGYNLTQLEPYDVIDKNIVHRDQLSHIFRWSFVLNRAKIGMKILDFGTGTSLNLLETFYRNRYRCKKYLGIDIRNLNEKGKALLTKTNWSQFQKHDLVKDNIFEKYGNDFDIITSFEVIEHISRTNADKFLKNIAQCCNKKTKVFLSTPIYNEKIGAAGNHTYDGNDGFGKRRQEFTYHELKIELEKYFIIEEIYGTFISQKDYKCLMNKYQIEIFNSLSKYYDCNLMSNIMAPLFPKQARNCIWILRKI